jgi:uncharacterized protein (DUF2147 family)
MMIKTKPKSTFLFALLVLFIVITGFDSNPVADRLIGVWESEEKNLRIQMLEEDGQFVGKMLWFQCSSESVMHAYRDTENPDPSLTSRPLVGMKLVEKLSYHGDNTWGNGKIYDPNSGYTYDAQIHLTSHDTAVVRGYWKFKWFGKSMVFHRVE